MSVEQITPGYKRTEMGLIPEDWSLVAAGEIGRFRGGSGFPTKYQGGISGVYPFFKVSDMNNEGNETFMRAANNYISETTRKALGANLFQENSIVFAKVGAAVFLERKKILAQQSCLDNNMAAYELDEIKADYRFIHYRLLHTKFGDLVSTTALPSLSGAVLSKISFPLPSLPEQRAIAAALSDADALLAKIDQLIAKKRDLKQAAMQQLLTGQTRLPGFSAEWEVKRLGDVASLYQPATISASVFTKDGFPVYGANGIVGYYHDFNHVEPQVTVTCRGSTCGTVNLTAGKSWITGNAMVINCDDSTSIAKDFLYQLLMHQDLTVCITGSGQPQIVRGPLANFDICIPLDREEQAAIANVLSDLDAELASFEARRDKTRAIKRGMMQKLLTGSIRLI